MIRVRNIKVSIDNNKDLKDILEKKLNTEINN